MLKQEVESAVSVLKNGGIICYPTDTVWGLGCDATNSAAIKKLFAIKKRSENNSMIILVSSLEMLEEYVEEIPEIAISLVKVADSPLTIVYPNAQYLAPEIIAEDGSIGARVVKHTFCQELLKQFGKPIVSTSANISGSASPARFDQISNDVLLHCDMIVKEKFAGAMTGKPSSIIKVDIDGVFKIIRQ